VSIRRDDLDRRIVSLAIPALGTLAVEPIYILVDTAIVGRLGTDQLAGMAIASTILLTVASIATFLEYGVTPDVAYAHGAGRPHEARTAAGDALALAFETQKKYEHVAEQAEILALRKVGRLESAQMDELGLRKAAGGR